MSPDQPDRSAAPFIVGLTGNVAAGKSTVLGWFRAWGAFVTDADAVVRELQQPGTPVYRAIVARFGPGVVTPDGGLRRDALRRLVLDDPAARGDLNAIVHPAVAARRAGLEAEARHRRARIVVHDIPLLFEAADPASFDCIVLVEAPAAVRRARLIRERGLSRAEADCLIATQEASETKRPRSQLVIENDGDLVRLESRSRDAWRRIVEAAARAP